MKALVLREVKVKEREEMIENKEVTEMHGFDAEDYGLKENKDYNMPIGFDASDYDNNSNSVPLAFDESDYDNANVAGKRIIKNTDDFCNYTISTEHMQTYKEVRTSTERRPCLMYKNGKDNEANLFYKSVVKMDCDKSVRRIGYVIADKHKKVHKLSSNTKKNIEKYTGTLNERSMICRKKPSNYKKVGYFKVFVFNENSTSYTTDYVEVITKRGYKWLIMLLLMFIIFLYVIFTGDFDNWHVDLNNMRFFKNSESSLINENELEIGVNAMPVLTNGLCNLDLSSIEKDGVTFKARLMLNESIIWESDEIKSGDGVDTVKLNTDLVLGEYSCELACDAYKNNKFIGTVYSDVNLVVK